MTSGVPSHRDCGITGRSGPQPTDAASQKLACRVLEHDLADLKTDKADILTCADAQ